MLRRPKSYRRTLAGLQVLMSSSFDRRRLIIAGAFARAAATCVAMSALGNGGCLLWRQQNPVSESLVASRQYAQQGVNAMERQNLDDAEKLLAQAVHACPDDAAAHRHYADVLWQQRRSQEALKQIVEAAEQAPLDAGILLRAGELHLQAGQLPQALAYVQRTLDIDPKCGEAWAVRARVMRQSGDQRQALADAQRALRFDPRRRDMLLFSADLYRAMGDPHRALTNLQALADTYGPGEEPSQLYVDQALTFGQMARHDDAVRVLHEAQRRDPASSEVLTLLCEAESAAGRPMAAMQAARQALAVSPDDPRCRELVERTALTADPAGAVRR